MHTCPTANDAYSTAHKEYGSASTNPDPNYLHPSKYFITIGKPPKVVHGSFLGDTSRPSTT
jgi:hypothetical protein